VDTHLFLLFR